MSITTTIKPNADLINFRLSKKMNYAITNVEKAVAREAIHLVGYVKQNKLSGQVLKVRTGRLRRSITYRNEKNGSTFTAFVGTNVKYARPFELGFSGTVNVKAHAVKEFRRMQSQAFGKPMKNPREVTVKAHSVRSYAVKLNIQPRPFLVPSLTENSERIQKNIREAIREALRA